MSDYEVGYGKPPKHTRFKKGVCPNPRGRGRKRNPGLQDTVLDVLSAKTEYRERGRVKKASRLELTIKQHIAAALESDLGSAAMLLTIRSHAEKQGRLGPLYVNIINSPDAPRRTKVRPLDTTTVNDVIGARGAKTNGL
jgi:hypothetical protein